MIARRKSGNAPRGSQEVRMDATPGFLATYQLPKLVLALFAGVLALSACGSRTQQQGPAATATQPQVGTTEPASAAPEAPGAPVTQASWAPDTLDKLVAPIALYPDQLVGLILAASVNSQEVLDAGNWLLQNQNLKGDALDAAAQKAGFGPPTRALVQFPSVVDMMCQEMDWTRQLGAAFTSDEKAVLDAVQSLRAQAAQVGNLKSTPEQKVETKTENNKTIIEVQPANPQVVYVPQYNPAVVYTTPPPPAPPASTTGTVSTGAAVAGGLVAFGVGMLIGSAIHSDDYCYPHWGAGAVYVGPRPFYPPAYVYRPVYGPAFRPATGYIPPPGYRYGYNNVNVNRNVNVNVNNNYFNQFNHNQNLRGATQSNLSRATENNLNGATRNPGWKGQSTYAGAHASPAQTARFNEATGRPIDSGLSGSSSPRAPAGTAGKDRVGGTGGTRNPALANNRRASPRPGENRTASTVGEGRGPAQDRGYGTSNRGTGESGLGASRSPGGGGVAANSGGGNLSRGGGNAVGSSAPQRGGAFSGAGQSGGGGFERAASARGHASAGAGVGARGGGHGRR
jgi:hypothetical protein